MAAARARLAIPAQLLAHAVPLVPVSGFSVQTLRLASLSLPPPHTPSPPGYSQHTIDNLFPSAPASASFKKSLSREELLADARGLGGVGRARIGPAKALVETWLVEGRRVMVEHVAGRWTGEQGVREGIRQRLRYNEPVRSQLADVSPSCGCLRDIKADRTSE